MVRPVCNGKTKVIDIVHDPSNETYDHVFYTTEFHVMYDTQFANLRNKYHRQNRKG